MDHAATTQSLPGYPVHTCFLVIVRWMVEFCQTLHSPSTFQSCTVFCVHTGSCPIYSHPAEIYIKYSYLYFYLAKVRFSLHFFVYLVRLGWFFIITWAIEGNVLKKSTMSSISISSILRKTPAKFLSVAGNGVGTLVCYSTWLFIGVLFNLELMLLNNFVPDFKQRNLAFDGIIQF